MGDLLMRVVARRRAVGVFLVMACATTASVVMAQSQPHPVNERGPVDAPVTVVEFCSYDSDACSRLDIVLGGVLAELGDRVHFVFRHVPDDETPAASLRYRAALAAGQQGQFWPMHELLMANRQRATPAEIPAMARQLGLDAERFRTDLDSAETIAAAKADQDEAGTQNIAAVPAVIVNGRAVAAISNAKDLRAAIRLALAAR
jgi:protein-disulfide isomerase